MGSIPEAAWGEKGDGGDGEGVRGGERWGVAVLRNFQVAFTGVAFFGGEGKEGSD